jgi:hypothetical protein
MQVVLDIATGLGGLLLAVVCMALSGAVGCAIVVVMFHGPWAKAV